MADRISFDEFDWSGGAASPAPPPSSPPYEEEPAPPSAPSLTPHEPAPRRSGGIDIDESLLPPAAREYGAKNIYKRRPVRTTAAASFDDFDWAALGPEIEDTSTYRPQDDWALTRGFKHARETGKETFNNIFEMDRISSLPSEQQTAAMLEFANRKPDPAATKLQVPEFTDISGAGEALTWLGESAASMVGSMVAAAEVGGLPGAGAGAVVGGGVGATALGAGALPGAVAGGVAGFGYGTMGAFAGMGIGGMFQDLLRDPGVQAGLQDSSITPNEIMTWSIGAGTAIGALDVLPVTKLAGMFGLTKAGKELTKDQIKTTIKKAALNGALKQGAYEGITEAGQGAISELGQAVVGGDVKLGERAWSTINQGLAGAVGGAGPGAIAGVSQNARVPGVAPVVAPHAPAGGYGQQPPPPAGAGREFKVDYGKGVEAPTVTETGAPITEVQPGEVAPDVAAALGEEEEFEEEPEAETVVPEGVLPTAPAAAAQQPRAQRAPPAEAAPAVSADISAALTAIQPELPLPGAGSVREPAPGPSKLYPEEPGPPQVPPEPQAPSAPPAPPAPPRGPAEARYPVAGAPPIGPAENVSVTEGLPDYQDLRELVEEEPAPTQGLIPEAVEEIAPVAPIEQPLVEEVPVAAEPVKPRLPKAEQAKRVAMQRYAEAVNEAVETNIDATAALWSTREKLDQLADNLDRYTAFYGMLSDQVQAAIGRRYEPGAFFAERAPALKPSPGGLAGSRRGAKPLAGRRGRPEVEGPQRFPERPETPLPVAKVETETRAERMTPERYRAAVTARSEEAAHELLTTRGTARHPKTKRRIGKIMKIARRVTKDEETGELVEGEYEATVGGRTKPVPLSELLEKYHVEISGVRVAKLKPLRGYKKTPPSPPPSAPVTVVEAAKPKRTVKEIRRAAAKRSFEFKRRAAAAQRRAEPSVPAPATPMRTVEREVTSQLMKSGLKEDQIQEREMRLAVTRAINEAQSQAEARGEPVRTVVHDNFDDIVSRAASYFKQLLTKHQYREMLRKSLAVFETEPIPEVDVSARLQEPRKRFEASIMDIVARKKKGKLSDEEATMEMLHAQEQRVADWNKIIFLEKLATKRTGKKAGIESAAMRLQNYDAIRKLARYEMKKEESKRDPLLVEMVPIFDLIGKDFKTESKQYLVNRRRARIMALQKERIKRTEKAERQAEKAKEKFDKLTEQEAEDLNEFIDARLGSGDMDLETADQLRKDEAHVVNRYKKRIGRNRKTGAILRQAIAKTQLPVTEEVSTKYKKGAKRPRRRALSMDIIDTRTYHRAMSQWAPQFVADVEAALEAIGEELPSEPHSFFNTPEENGIIFIKSKIRKAARPAREKKEGVRPFVHNVYDVGMVIHFLKHMGRKISIKKGKKYDKEASAKQRMDNKESLYGVIFDASKTESTPPEAPVFTASQIGAEIHAFNQRMEEESARVEADISEELGKRLEMIPQDEVEREARRLAEAWGVPFKLRKGTHFAAVPEGWGTVEGGAAPIKLDEAERKEIEGIVQQASGLSRVEWVQELRAAAGSPQSIAWGRPGEEIRGRGAYDYATDAVMLAMDVATPRVAYHEAFHRLQRLFLNDREKAVLKAEVTRLRAIVASALDRKEQAARMISSELEAEAFAIHATSGSNIQPNPILARAWNRIATMIRRVKSWLNGHGYQTSEDIFNAAAAGKIKLRPMRERMAAAEQAFSMAPTTASPLSLQNASNIVTQMRRAGRGFINKVFTSTEDLRRLSAEEFFEGEYDNPLKKLIDELETHPRQVADERAAGDEMDSDIRRWWLEDPTNRKPDVDEMHRVILDASLGGVDPRKTLQQNTWIRNDADHPLSSGKPRLLPTWAHVRDTGKRALHARVKAEWDALPQELKDMVSKRLDHMNAQMRKYERKTVSNLLKLLTSNTNRPVTLPPFVTHDIAVTQILANKMSPALKKALGDSGDTFAGIGRLSQRGGMYVPAFRAGQYFISGRYDVATPTGAVVDQKAFDDRDVLRFVFSDETKANAYVTAMQTSGDEHITGFSRWYADPATNKVSKAKTPGSVPIYYVTVQHRFMAMSDSKRELTQMKQDLQATGKFKVLSDPILTAEQRDISSGAVPLKMAAMLRNLNTMSGIDEQERDLVKASLAHIFIQTQGGNQITKKLRKRSGVHGYEVGANEMTRSFASNNDMMSRHIVSLDRIPNIKAGVAESQSYIDALRYGGAEPKYMKHLSPSQQALITRQYAKGDTDMADRLAQVQKELVARIEGHMASGKGRAPFAQNAFQALLATVTINYLASPAYYALQTIGLYLQTYPRFAAEIAGRHGVFQSYTMAGQYMHQAAVDIGWLGNYWEGAAEAVAEGRHFVAGFKPRKGFMGEGRPVRRTPDWITDVKARVRANNAKYAAAKVKALEAARKAGFIGQAGLDQPNVNLSLMAEGKGALGKAAIKAARGIEKSARVFRAMQEGIEINNRAIPLLSYVEYFMDIGVAEDQAVALAMNRMTAEQTGYGKENWPTWMSKNMGVSAALMFKKFAIQQAFNYWDSLMRAGFAEDPEMRRIARFQVANMTMMLALVGGFVGNPLWEPFKYLWTLMTSLFGGPSYEELKSDGEKLLASYVGGMPAEMLVYGAPRALGFDVSSRIALDSTIFFQMPVDQTPEAWYAVMGQTIGGAPLSMLMDARTVAQEAVKGDQSYPKWLSKMPAPKVVKDIFKAYDLYENGPTTKTGVSAGKPTGLMDAAIQAFGFRPRSQTRPFEQGSAAQHRKEERISEERSATMRRLLNQGLTPGNMTRVRDWNRSHPGKDERITVRDLTKARKRRRETEREIEQANQ